MGFTHGGDEYCSPDLCMFGVSASTLIAVSGLDSLSSYSIVLLTGKCPGRGSRRYVAVEQECYVVEAFQSLVTTLHECSQLSSIE